ncbi:DoxX family membrane protein [Evansella cellulosilytica]|uniref:DoxX family membrane protein n=1 Tax=Evansella cellulosilytica (strain ATCC 21833 / DSM 2522 / FERM P-1141 / JCM 9156 / N-4) TaxID=649639 RepID=E6U0D3_EVAC2|nr:DoxX family membrane protein [Evansella cellulosilytica]ADU30249.1 hypothetical protein Bcell_1987 [Evansella cellulosilytica DSM 2522]
MKRLSTATALITIIFVLFIPFVVSSHVKWFTDVIPEKEMIENIISPFFIVMTIIIAIILAILPQMLPKLMEFEWSRKTDRKLEKYRPFTFPILRYGTGLALIIQVVTGGLFAPELQYDMLVVPILTWIAIICLFIPHRYSTRTAAFIILCLFINKLFQYGVFHMLDYGFYLAIVFVLITGKTKYEQWGFPFLYLATGLSLCWVAVEKWVYPVMAVDVINHHGVPTFGFSPEIFVSLTAFIEFVVGYLLVVGILNRLLAFVLTGIFVMTTMLFGFVEIIGHFMIHIILITFIIEGVSFYKPPIKMHKTKVDQIIFVFLNFIFVLSTIMLIYYRFA